MHTSRRRLSGRASLGGFGREVLPCWWVVAEKGDARGQAQQQSVTTASRRVKQQPSVPTSVSTRPVARFLVGSGPYVCPYVTRSGRLRAPRDAAGGGALPLACPASSCAAHTGAVQGLRTAHLQALRSAFALLWALSGRGCADRAPGRALAAAAGGLGGSRK
jgi:hypothetical protein